MRVASGKVKLRDVIFNRTRVLSASETYIPPCERGPSCIAEAAGARRRIEIRVLRHELGVRRRNAARARLEARDRTLLAVLSHLLPRERWSAFWVKPATPLRSDAHMIRRRWTDRHGRTGRPALDPDVVVLVVRLVRESARWGHRRIVGELQKLGIPVSETSVAQHAAQARDPAGNRRTGPS